MSPRPGLRTLPGGAGGTKPRPPGGAPEPPAARPGAAGQPHLRDRFALFAECLLTGVWVLAAALPLVTLLPAFAAGCAHLRRHLAGERAGLREFAADVRRATRTGWRWSLAWWAGLGLLAFDVRVAVSGVLPGGGPMAAAGSAGLAVLVVTGLRAAAASSDAAAETCGAPRASGGRPDTAGPAYGTTAAAGQGPAGARGPRPPGDWPPAREALHRTCVADPVGSALLAGGLLVVAVAAWQLLPLAVPALGCLAACAVAVEHRHEARLTGASAEEYRPAPGRRRPAPHGDRSRS